MTIEICKQIASELLNRYMEIMDSGGDQSEADSVGTPFKDGHLAIEFALKEIERITAERDVARRSCCEYAAIVDGADTADGMESGRFYEIAMKYMKDRRWDCFKGVANEQ